MIHRTSIIAYGSVFQDGGLNVPVEATQFWQSGSIVYANTFLSVVEVLKTRFIRNSANDRGGGLFIDQHEKSIIIYWYYSAVRIFCRVPILWEFKSNFLGDGAAVHILKREIPDTIFHMNPLFSFSFTNCTFKYNKLNVEIKCCSFAFVYSMILLFIQCLQRRSNICCLQWVDRWRPFFEAYTSPCRINYHFWPGFLFLTQLTLSTLILVQF